MLDRETLRFADAASFEKWLAKHYDKSEGVYLAIAKKDTGIPSVTHQEALDICLCYGWIDGVRNSLDDERFLQSFSPRRARSTWSQINRDKVAALIAAGRMRPPGQAEIDRAKADGRWDAAYAGQKTITVPADLQKAIDANPKAKAFFATLSSQNRFAILFRVGNVKKEETRVRNIAKFVAMLERGETIYPQAAPKAAKPAGAPATKTAAKAAAATKPAAKAVATTKPAAKAAATTRPAAKATAKKR